MATKKQLQKKPAARKPSKTASKVRGTVTPKSKGIASMFQRLGKKRGALVFVLVFAVAGSVLLFTTHAQAPTPQTAQTWDNLAPQIRTCESGNNYSINTGNGYHGAYQFSHSTWQNMPISLRGNYYDANNAPAHNQDAAAYYLYLNSGLGSWPVCGYPPHAYSSHYSSVDSTGGYGPRPNGTPAPSPQPGSHPTPVSCHYIGVKYGHRAYNCDFFSNSPIYNYNTRVGYFRGSPDWVICQENSATFHKSSSVYNVYWGYTLSDSPNHWGWVNATYAKTGTNNGPYGGVPDCSSAGISTSNAGHVPTLTHP